MGYLGYIKEKLRPTIIYKPFFLKKQWLQEKEYLAEREKSYRQVPDVFSSPGYLHHSRALLDRGWQRQRPPAASPKEVRLFVVDRTNMPIWWLQHELQKSFDAKIMSTLRHRTGYLENVRDLVALSTGGEFAEMPYINCQEAPDYAGWKVRFQKDLLRAIQEFHAAGPIDLCFLYGSLTDFDPETIRQIRALGIPTCLWWLDEKHAFIEHPSWGYPNGQVPLIGSCDVHLTNTFEAIRWYMARGAAAYYFPQAIDPERTEPRNLKRDIPVSFIGQAYGFRLEFIKKLKRAGIPIQCFGLGWGNGWAENHLDIFNRSIINLGIGSTGFSARMTCLKGRDFEIPATGNFYLTTFDPELTRHFQVGKEIACYLNEIDCVEQIRYYLERPDEAGEIGRAGRERCLAAHTWTHRMIGLL